MSNTPKQSRKFTEIELAYESCNGSGEMSAYVSKKTGEVVYDCEPITGEPCPVEDIDCHEDYIHVPDQMDLNLGTNLVWQFIAEQIPGLEPKVREMFRSRGAYRRWKVFLDQNDLLDNWYAFEEDAKQKALHTWCTFNKIPLEDSPV